MSQQLSRHFLILILLSMVIIVNYAMRQKYQCDKEKKASDLAAINYFIVAARSRKLPENQNQLQRFCSQNPKIEKQLQTFISNCFDKLTKRIANLVLYSSTKTSKNLCNSRRRSAQFIELGECGNAANKGNKKCWNNWILLINRILLTDDVKIKIPLSCCITYNIKNCFIQNYESLPKVCPQKSIDGLDRIFASMVTDVMGLICGEYVDDSDKCDKILHKIPELGNRTLDNSPISLLAKLLDSFPVDEF